MLCAPSGPISGSRGQRKACQCSAGTCCLLESVLGSTRARTFIFCSTSPSRPYPAVCSVERFSSLSAPGSAKHGPVCYRVSFRTGSACACVWGRGDHRGCWRVLDSSSASREGPASRGTAAVPLGPPPLRRTTALGAAECPAPLGKHQQTFT